MQTENNKKKKEVLFIKVYTGNRGFVLGLFCVDLLKKKLCGYVIPLCLHWLTPCLLAELSTLLVE
jgi:hypothetical protein